MSSTPNKHGEEHPKPHKKHGGHGHGGGGHEEGHEGAPEWLISFADMVMLMMGFFVILFALNNKPTGRDTGGTGPESEVDVGGAEPSEKMLDFAIGVRQAFNNPVDIHSTNPQDAPLVRRLVQRAGQSETRDQGIKGREQDVQSLRQGDYYALSGSVPFPEYSSEIPAANTETIIEIARKVRGLRLIVEVRGHVSSVEASKGSEAAMQLALERAMAVARALAEQNVAWWQLEITACADHRRVEAHPSNRTADKANARVEVILTDQVVPDAVPTQYKDQAG